MHDGTLDDESRGMVAALCLGSELFSLANRLGLFPAEVANKVENLLDICDRSNLAGWCGFACFENHA
jgi:hypothetical protein